MILPPDIKIIDAMAKTLWVLAWADYQEQVLKRGLQGKIDDQAPAKIPDLCLHTAYFCAGRIYQANTRTLFFLSRDAHAADAREAGDIVAPYDDEYQREFGSDLAMMLAGTGVSWFDDHAKFNLKMPMCMEWNWLSCEIDEALLAEN